MESYVTAKDGVKLRIFSRGEGVPVLVLPGLAEHMGRYEHVVEMLVAAGYRAVVLEFRGHGASDGRRGHVMSWDEYVLDVEAAAATCDGAPVLLGHSTGGLIALYTAAVGLSTGIRALAVSAPNVLDTIDAPVKKALGKALSSIWPTFTNATGLNPDLLTHDADVVKKYREHPMVFGTVTARWYTELLRAQAHVRASASSGRLPLLTMVGTEDQIVAPGPALEHAKAWGGPSETREYDGFYHEIFNEVQKDQVFDDLKAWLATTLAESDQ